MINNFAGDNEWCSNFFKCEVKIFGYVFGSSEAAYHAAKNLEYAEVFTTLPPALSKRMGHKIPIRPDWEQVKDAIMLEIVQAKFAQHPELARKLIATGNEYLEEGNYWHDNYWGNCYCERCERISGKNRLGMILMQVRKELQEKE